MRQPASHHDRRSRHRRPTRHRAAGPLPRRDSPHHLHVGDYRRAQGCGRHPAQHHPTARFAHRRPPASAGVEPVPLLRVRLLGVGDLGRAAARRAVGGGARIGNRRARGVPGAAGRRAREPADPNSVIGGGAVARGGGPGGAVDRRRGVPGRGGGPMGAGTSDAQRLRAHRDHDVRGQERTADGGRDGPDRLTGAERRVPGARRLAAPGAGRGDRGAVRGRARCRLRLRTAARVDGYPVRGVPGGLRTTHVSHRGPGALEQRRAAGVHRALRRPGQNPRLPYRARRNTLCAGTTGRGRAGGRAGAGRPPGRQAPSRVRHRHRRSRRAARRAGRTAAGTHGACGHRGPRRNAVDGQWKTRHPGPARP
ncbi:hypothetical protein MYSI104531_24585 [Mycobacterium simiae]